MRLPLRLRKYFVTPSRPGPFAAVHVAAHIHLIAGVVPIEQTTTVLREFNRDVLRALAAGFGDHELALAELVAHVLGLADHLDGAGNGDLCHGLLAKEGSCRRSAACWLVSDR
jgi:hypothetical protein